MMENFFKEWKFYINLEDVIEYWKTKFETLAPLDWEDIDLVGKLKSSKSCFEGKKKKKI